MPYSQPRGTISAARPAPARSGAGGVRQALSRRVLNLPIRVPAMDWDAVVCGQKRMFRAYCERARDPSTPIVLPGTEVPRPCLLFATRYTGPRGTKEYKAVPGVLIAHRQEPLGAISPEDLAAEGFKFLPAFRFYWKRRYQKLGWRPWDMVSVVEVRPVYEDDHTWVRDWIHDQLYAEWLDA